MAESNGLQEKNTILTFIRLTKEGKYAPIDEETLSIPRQDDERIAVYDECEYYYSIR